MQSVLGLAGKLVGELLSPVFRTYIAEPWAHGSTDEFEKLKKTMFAINALLLDAEERQQTTNQIQHWLREIKLVFYDVEDLLQEVTTKALKRQAKTRKRKRGDTMVRISFSRPNDPVIRLNMGSKVKLIREKLDAIFLDSKIFNFTQRDESRGKKREETHSFVPVDKFIGREDDKKYVTKLLVESDVAENVSVVSVIGVGGMGKTTLAQSIYNSDEVKSKFECRMWVCVSDPFDVKLICENIIMSVTSNICDRLPMEIVKEKLKSSIDGKRYLLVLDDVWNDKQMEWEKLEVLLAGGARGSRILITARAKLVADAAKSIATHVLKGLSPEESWVLFKQIAFKQGVEQVSPTMEGIGKEVLVKCAGVPLVIKAMGSILALKEREIDWLDFKKYDLPRVSQDSEGTVLPILRFSYDYLSAPLKRCFVYCAIYPKDHEIEKKELIGMWVAHGLIQLDGTRRSLEDVGERHFMDLLSRSFFEVHLDEVGSTYYKMHDLIHDLAQSVGGDEYYKHGSGAKCMSKSIRHAWVSGYELTNIGDDGQKLYTLVVTRPYDEQKFNELTSSTFQQLRVLRMRRLGLTSVPQFVGGLRHLYYLDLSNNRFSSLPESIGSLYNLQTLILFDCSKLEELPAGTRDLGSLRHLDIGGCVNLRYMPRGLEELTCLQTLNHFVCPEEKGSKRGSYAEMCELKSLVNLRGTLVIRNIRGSLAIASCILVELELITQLKLSWSTHQYKYGEAELHLIESLKPHPNLERLTILRYPGSKFPSWMDRVNIRVSLPNIVYIHLENCLSLRHLPALGLLPSLQKLYLADMNCIEHLIDSRSSVEEEAEEPLFPSLKELHLTRMYQLKRVVEPTESSANKRYFPALEKLVIEHCWRLRHLPALGLLPSLQKLYLADMNCIEHLIDSRSSVEEEAEEPLFPSLKELHLTRMYQLKTVVEPTESSANKRYFPALEKLVIEHCWRLRHLPALGLLPSLQKLYLVDMNCIEHLIDSRSTVEEEAEEPLFPSLKELHLTGMDELKRVVEPTESSGSTTNKKRYFPVLEKLVIKQCPLFLADGSNEDGKLFASLLEVSFSSLEFRGGADIKTLPSGLQYLPHLQILTIFDCHNIVSLPDWMGNLTSLQELHLHELCSLASIPDCLQSLTSLQRLLIKNCTKLVRRCKKETGVDWHKIAHIPDITVEDEFYAEPAIW